MSNPNWGKRPLSGLIPRNSLNDGFWREVDGGQNADDS
jgi:hypothetical protein